MSDVDDDLALLVAAEPTYPGAPDVARLRAGGRRRLLRRRLATGAAATALVVAAGVPLLVGSDRDPVAIDPAPAAPTTSSGSPDTAVPDADADADGVKVSRYERGEAPLQGGGALVGAWEDGEIVGRVVSLGTYDDGYERFLYAAEAKPSRGEPFTCVSVGVRVEGRMLRLLCALTPLDPDGPVLWGGGRHEEGVPAGLESAGYLVVGAVRGETGVSVATPGRAPQPVSGRSTAVLPGWTVFHDQAAWDEEWDALQLAPLTVSTGAGQRLEVRERSYES